MVELVIYMCLSIGAEIKCFETRVPEAYKDERQCLVVANDLNIAGSVGTVFAAEARCVKQQKV